MDMRYLQALIAHLKDYALLVFDADLRMVWANGPWLAELGYCSPEWVGRRLADLFTEKQRDLLQPLVHAALHGQSNKAEMSAFGRLCLVDTVPLPSEAADQAEGMLIFQDITRKRGQEMQNLHDVERFRRIAHLSHDAIYDIDLQTGAAWYSEGYYHLFGDIPRWNHLGQAAWLERVHPDDRDALERYIDEMIGSRAVGWLAEYRVMRRDGSTVSVIDQAEIIRDENHQASQMIGALTDVTDRKQAELLRLEEEKRRALTQFIETTTHMVRSQLSTINTSVYLLRHSTEEPRREQASERLFEQVQQLEMLMEKLYLTAQVDSPETYRWVRVEIERVLHVVVDSNAAELAARQISAEVQANADTPPVHGDYERLTEALRVLCNHALAQAAAESQLLLQTTTATEGVLVTLTAQMDPFLSTTSTPSGSNLPVLDLLIAEKIIQAHGGTLTINHLSQHRVQFSVLLVRYRETL
ncbi:MAG: PAS domain S-box protein [Anaerolineae bacterium]|nr:PAS domain S-box protein [Anaerolineae bacterium]